jgi:hypothetical protein
MLLVSLATLIKDRKGILLKPLSEFLPVLKGIYEEIVIVSARNVHEDVVKNFKKYGMGL